VSVRLLVIGDVHACDERLARLLAHVDALDVDAACCVGDVVTGPGDPNRCVAGLRDAGVVTTRGNHDRWLLEGVRTGIPDAHTRADLDPSAVSWLAACPAVVPVQDAGTRVILCHALPDDDMNRIGADDYGYALDVNDPLQALLATGQPTLVLKGHRHAPALFRVGSVTICDVGTLLPECGSAAAVVDLEARVLQRLALVDGGVVAAAVETLA
jgi:predicted phosphodiesterase